MKVMHVVYMLPHIDVSLAASHTDHELARQPLHL